MSRQEFEVIIVGGGVMGCSVAYHLLVADPTLSVAVIEADPGYSRASSALSVGNARIQFSLEGEHPDLAVHLRGPRAVRRGDGSRGCGPPTSLFSA